MAYKRQRNERRIKWAVGVKLYSGNSASVVGNENTLTAWCVEEFHLTEEFRSTEGKSAEATMKMEQPKNRKIYLCHR
jgi:hypothetical protein